MNSTEVERILSVTEPASDADIIALKAHIHTTPEIFRLPEFAKWLRINKDRITAMRKAGLIP